MIHAALDEVPKQFEEEEYLDSDYAVEAIAACDVIARLKGRFGQKDTFTEKVDEWVNQHPQSIDAALASKAVAVLDRIVGQDSELNELWKDSDHYDKWKSSIDALKARIQS